MNWKLHALATLTCAIMFVFELYNPIGPIHLSLYAFFGGLNLAFSVSNLAEKYGTNNNRR